MKKGLLLFIELLAFVEIIAQVGYRFNGKFIQLMPSNAEQYFVQTKNAESKLFLEKATKKAHNQNTSNNVYMISDSTFLISSKSNLSILSEDDYISELF
jgi:hypothetical protein